VLTNGFGHEESKRRDADGQPAAVRCGSVGRRIADEPGGDGSGKASFTVKEGTVPTNCSPATIQWQVSTNGVNWNNVSGGKRVGCDLCDAVDQPTSISESGNEYGRADQWFRARRKQTARR